MSKQPAWLPLALSLRAQGLSYQTIGARLGISRQMAYGAITRAARAGDGPAWWDQAIQMHQAGASHVEIGRALGKSHEYVCTTINRLLYPRPAKPATFKPLVPRCAAIRPPEPEVRLGAPANPPPFVKRPIRIPEAEPVKMAPGLWVSK